MKQFKVAENRAQDFDKHLKRLNKKRTKSGQEPFKVERSPIYYERVQGDKPPHWHPDMPAPTYKKGFFNYTLEGETNFKIEGFEIIGLINNKDNIVYKFIDEEGIVLNTYAGASNCDHCNTKRHRNKIFIVREVSTGKLLEIGSNCVKDYIGIDADHFSFFPAQQNFFEEEWNIGGGSSVMEYHLETVLQITIQILRKESYKNSQCDYPTKHLVNMYLSIELEEGENPEWLIEKYFEADYEKAKDIAQYFKNLEGDLNDYMYNLKSISHSGWVNSKHLGYAVSMVPTYNRIHEAQEQEKPQNGHWFEDKDKVEIKLTYKKSVHFDTEYGISFIQRFVDENNRVFVYKGSSPVKSDQLELDDCLNLKVTIKHDFYKGTPQTRIMRPKVIE